MPVSLLRAFVIFALWVVSVCPGGSEVAAQPYRVEQHKDKKGFVYETVTNDPVGLRVYTLANGLKVYLARDQRPNVLFAVATRVGYVHDPADNTGLAHYEEHLLFNGTDRLGALHYDKEAPLLDSIEDLYEKHRLERDSTKKRQLFRRIDSLSYQASLYASKNEYRSTLAKIGGFANGVTNMESAVYGGEVPPGALRLLLATQSEMFRKPVFRAFGTELEIVYEEFNSFQDNAFMRKYYAANQLIFPTHPYGRPGIGTAQHLKNPSMRAIKTHYNKYYVPNNMALILVGNIDFDQTIQWVQEYFGDMRPQPLPRASFSREKEITQPLQIEMSGPEPASVFMAFRMGGMETDDPLYLTLIGKLFENTSFNLLNEELRSTRRVANAVSYSWFQNNDYSVHYLEGMAHEGQSLDEVKNALLSLLDKIKKGDFDERLIAACANELKIDFQKDITVNHNLDAECAKLFTQFTNWRERLSFIDRLQRVTRQQLMDFANRVYGNNYAVIYKKKGPPDAVVKMQNPGTRPLAQQDTALSDFAKSLNKIPVQENQPKTVDFAKEIHSRPLRNGVEWIHIENRQTDLFDLSLVFDIGRRDDRKLALAVGYIPYAATSKYSATELKKELFMQGLSFRATAQDDRIVFQMQGLSSNLPRAVSLLSHILYELRPSQESYDRYVSSMLGNRKAVQGNKSVINNSLYDYVLYGDAVPFRNSFSEAELKGVNPSTLTDAVKNITALKHRVLFYGKGSDTAAKLLMQLYPQTLETVAAEKKKPTVQPTQRQVYFVDFDGSQAEIRFVIRGEKFDPRNMALTNLLNRFIGQVCFNEVREKRSLAYNAWGALGLPVYAADYNHLTIFAASQVSKLGDALRVMDSICKDIRPYEGRFEETKKELLKYYESDSKSGTDLYWDYDRLNKLGIGKDEKAELYRQTMAMQFSDLVRYFNSAYAGKQASLLVVANKKDIPPGILSAYGEVKEITLQELFNYK